MSFRECIQTAIDSGRISAKKGGEAFDAYDRAFEKAKAAGEPDGTADMLSAAKTLDEITTLKGARKWQRLNEMQRAHELHSRLMKSNDPAEELQRIIVDLEAAQETVRSFTMAHLDQLMLTYMPRGAGLLPTNKDFREIVRAAYPETRGQTSKAAQELADSVITARETLRKWANMYGASIPENANARLMQTHDSVKVQAVDEEEWVNDHLQSLDWEVMRFGGKEIAEEDRAEILSRTYQGIINDGFDRADVSQLHTPGLASRLNRDRFLYYKDADSYLAMQEKYGAGNFYEQTINMVEAMAKDISLLRVFGPHAESMKEFTKRSALKRAADINSAQPRGKRDKVKNMERQIKLFQDEYDIHSWHVTTSEGNRAVSAFSTVRTLAVNALLGFSFIPNLFGDLGNARAMRRAFNIPQVSVLRSYVKEWVPTKEKLAEATRMGVIFENAISLTQGRVRYFGSLDGPYWARRISDATYRLGLASHHTQVARNSQGKQFMGVLADWKGKKFDDLPFAPLLLERGVTPAEWDRMRSVPLYEIKGATFLRPIDLFRTGSPEDQRIAQKFSDAMQIYIRTMVPDTTLRSRRALFEATDPNSVGGQILRTMGSLVSFPTAVWFNQLHRIAQAPGIRNKINLGAKYAFWMTMAGAAIEVTRGLAQGKQVPDLTMQDEDGYLNTFWLRALVAGGGLGIVGDLVFNNINLSNSARFSNNPTVEYLEKLHKLTLDNAFDAAQTYLYEKGYAKEPGDEAQVAADALKFLDANVPDLWYTKLIWERALSDEWMAQADPAGWERKQRYLQENTPQGMWWAPEGEREDIRLETAVGG